MWQIKKPSRHAVPEVEPAEPAVDPRLVNVGDAGAFAKRDKHTELKVELHKRLLDLINLQALDQMSREQIEDEVGDIIHEELAKQNQALNNAERKQLVGDVLDELLGLGPLEPLLKDPTITDILVNGHEHVFVERYGQLEPTPVRFKDERHLLRIIQKIYMALRVK
jgi:pilus assembly protein CpaF